MMNKADSNAGTRFDRAIWVLARIWVYLLVLTAVVLVAVDAWLARAHHPTDPYAIIGTLVHVFWGWAVISLLQFYRGLRRLGPSERIALFSSGGRPTSPDELMAWRWGWQFAYACIAVLLAMAAAPVTFWLAGK